MSKNSVMYLPGGSMPRDHVIPTKDQLRALLQSTAGREIPMRRGAIEDTYGTYMRQVKGALDDWIPVTSRVDADPFSLLEITESRMIDDREVSYEVDKGDADTIWFAVNERYPLIKDYPGWVRRVTPFRTYLVRSKDNIQKTQYVIPGEFSAAKKSRISDVVAIADSTPKFDYYITSIMLDVVSGWSGYADADYAKDTLCPVRVGSGTETRKVWMGMGSGSKDDLVIVVRNSPGLSSEAGETLHNAKWWAANRPCPDDDLIS
jgi:hypothetical protein